MSKNIFGEELTLQHLKYIKNFINKAKIGHPITTPDMKITILMILSKCLSLIGIQALLSLEQVLVEIMQQ
jgi:hypothetical protein